MKNTYLTPAEIKAFVQRKPNEPEADKKRTEYYVNLYERNIGNTRFPSWNWSACLLGVLWFLYRKMYFYSFAFVVLSFFYPNTIWILSGLFGNALYFHHARKKIHKGHTHSGVDYVSPVILTIALMGGLLWFIFSSETFQTFRQFAIAWFVEYFKDWV